MNLRRMALSVICSTLACGVFGATIGGLIDQFLPHFYWALFPLATNPLELGIGLGLTQGIVFGAVIGLVLVGVAAWREVRLAEIESRKPKGD